jgi:hypothetical protein
MLDGYSAFLTNLKNIYPDLYLKIISFPDPIIIGWINEISENKSMIMLEDSKKVKDYFEMKIKISNIILKDIKL